jgi:hypothetical protein
MMAGAISILLAQHFGLSLAISLPLGFALTAGIDFLMESLNRAGAKLPVEFETAEAPAATESSAQKDNTSSRKRGKKGRK